MKKLTIEQRDEDKSHSDKRPIRFYCRGCDKQVFQGLSLEGNSERIGEMYNTLFCSDCILAKAKNANTEESNWKPMDKDIDRMESNPFHSSRGKVAVAKWGK